MAEKAKLVSDTGLAGRVEAGILISKNLPPSLDQRVGIYIVPSHSTGPHRPSTLLMSSSRTQKFVRNLTSGYLLMGLTIIYNFGSIPLALHYLSKEEFGLWALVVQVAGYFNMLDMGMGSSAARHLIEVKDIKSSPVYSSMVFTACLVFTAQGLLLIAGSFLSCSFLASLVKVPHAFVGIFEVLLLVQCLTIGFAFVTRIFNSLLTAHQRHDICNIASIVSLFAMLASLWAGFASGMNLHSMVLSQICGTLIVAAIQCGACWKLGLFPATWTRPQWSLFKEIFSYSKDIFLISLGSQLFASTQIIIITKAIGLEAAAVWSVGTKVFITAQMLAFRIFDYCYAAFSEMAVRQEWGRLRDRYRDAIGLVAAVAILTCVIAGVCNTPFLSVWTHGRIKWHWSISLLAALHTIVFCIASRYMPITTILKDVGFAKYIDFIKGALFVLLGYWLAKRWGFTGILLSATLLELAVSLPYALSRCHLAFGCTFHELLFGWLANAGKYFICWLPFIFLALFIALRTKNQYFAFGASCLLLLLSGFFLFWRMGLSTSAKELIKRTLLPRSQKPYQNEPVTS